MLRTGGIEAVGAEHVDRRPDVTEGAGVQSVFDGRGGPVRDAELEPAGALPPWLILEAVRSIVEPEVQLSGRAAHVREDGQLAVALEYASRRVAEDTRGDEALAVLVDVAEAEAEVELSRRRLRRRFG